MRATLLGVHDALARQREPPHDALELANVARPRVRFQGIDGLRRELEAALAHLALEVDDEAGDVLGALSQRRDVERHSREAKKEVLPELVARAQRLEVALTRGQEADVDLNRLRAAQRPERLAREHAGELALHLEREGIDVVEVERTFVRGE
jgi:hypothetical protein